MSVFSAAKLVSEAGEIHEGFQVISHDFPPFISENPRESQHIMDVFFCQKWENSSNSTWLFQVEKKTKEICSVTSYTDDLETAISIHFYCLEVWDVREDAPVIGLSIVHHVTSWWRLVRSLIGIIGTVYGAFRHFKVYLDSIWNNFLDTQGCC